MIEEKNRPFHSDLESMIMIAMKTQFTKLKSRNLIGLLLVLFLLDSEPALSLDKPNVKKTFESKLEKKGIFLSQLSVWASENNIHLGEDFELDRRFDIPICGTNFRFQQLKRSTVIAVSCDSSQWKRHINLKTASFGFSAN